MPFRLPIAFVLFTVLAACGESTDQQTENQAGAAAIAEPVTATPDHGVPLGRLPGHVRPEHYRLALTILPESSYFSGTSEIDLSIDRPVEQFFLHGRSFEQVQATLTTAGETFNVDYEQVDPSGVARIDLPGAIQGDATLRIKYTAPFNQSLEALYKVEAGGQPYAFTQFQAISAREAFPGFDEPAFKTPFDVSLTVHEDHTAISSGPAIKETALEEGLKRVDFQTTQPIPTYLLAFAVGPFDVVEAEDLPATDYRDRPVPLRGIAVEGRGPELRLALDNTRGILEAMEAYFGTPYPYAKLDILAVPDFGAGAMENVGAITYRDSIVLVAKDARPQIKRRLYEVHAHELAHQWFGNLVTPEWWDDIWLNESFATWVSYVALDIWQPEGQYRRDLKQRAGSVMNRDALTTARQIRQPVLSNHDIANAFDGITYSKGGAVLSMFEAFLGRDTFRSGVREHMRRHAWKTATAYDFIDALASQSTEHPPEAVDAAFRSFIEQSGLPMLEAELLCDEEEPRTRLSQSRYLPLGSTGDRSRTWTLPVCLDFRSGDSGTVQCLLMSEPESEFALSGDECPDLLMPNAGGTGYYRWNLDPESWRKLLSASDRLDVDELMSVAASLDGAFNAGNIDVTTYMQVARRLSDHKSYLVATAPLSQLDFIYRRLANADQREVLKAEYEEIYSDSLDRAGLATPSTNETAEMQALVTDFMAVRARLPELRESLREMAWSYVGFPDRPGVYPEGLNDNLIGTALTIAVQEDNSESAFSRHLEEALKASNDAVFRGRALDALGFSQHAAYRDRLLALTLSPELRDNEFYRPISRQLAEQETRDVAWNWMRENLDAILSRLPEWSKGYAAGYGRYFCDPQRKREVEEFFGPLVGDLQGGPRALASSLEAIELCIAKTEHHRPGLEAFLAHP